MINIMDFYKHIQYIVFPEGTVQDNNVYIIYIFNYYASHAPLGNKLQVSEAHLKYPNIVNQSNKLPHFPLIYIYINKCMIYTFETILPEFCQIFFVYKLHA